MPPPDWIEAAKAIPDLAKLAYEDLAQPGVRNLGKALGTVADVTNSILYPVALFNAWSHANLQRNIDRIRERLAKEDPEQVITAPPEITIPVMQKLGHTQDPDLVRLYVELMASASLERYCATAHPSFVNVIGNLSPDECRFLDCIREKKDFLKFHPHRAAFTTVINHECEQGSECLLGWLHDETYSTVPLRFPNNIFAYQTNLVGLGILDDVEVVRSDEPLRWERVEKAFNRTKWKTAKGPVEGLESDTIAYRRLSNHGGLFLEATDSNRS